MQKLINRLFHGGKPASRPAPLSRDNPLTIEDGSENATRRQLVQVLLRDLLRKSGVPPAWVECQMLPVSSRSRGHGLYVRLVAKHWDPRFLDYAYAFQKTLMTDIERFEPNSTSWLHGISWQLEFGAGCPHKELPEKSYWQAAPDAAAAAGDDNDPGSDLERLFAIRDQELDRGAANGTGPGAYEKTQPSPL